MLYNIPYLEISPVNIFLYTYNLLIPNQIHKTHTEESLDMGFDY